MLTLDDPIWDTFKGGYRMPYNAAARLQELERGPDDIKRIWEEFWEELHHQGDVDTAAYAVVPQLVRICAARNILDWNVFALVATIEEIRLFSENPPVPSWLESDYHSAIKGLAEFGAQNLSEKWPGELTQPFLAIVAFAKGSPNTGRMLIEFPEDEMEDVFEKFFA